MASGLQGAQVAFLAAAEGTEQSELTAPWEAVTAQGGQPVLVSPATGKIQLFEHLDRGETRPVDVQAGSARQEDYAGLVLPGGVANLTSCGPTRPRSPSPAASSRRASRWR